MKFIEFDLYSPALCLGERLKGALFRPCLKTAIPYSQISGALRRKFANAGVQAVGYFVDGDGYNSVEYLIYSPRDRVQGVSKLPLQVEFLSNARGKVFVLEDDFTVHLPDRFQVFMGALIHKGLGYCQLVRRRTVEAEYGKDPGILRTRIPLGKTDDFGIKRIINPVYGYLFEPVSPDRGNYVLSLFEGSEVIAPAVLVSPQERR